jgi:hypothetical protein
VKSQLSGHGPRPRDLYQKFELYYDVTAALQLTAANLGAEVSMQTTTAITERVMTTWPSGKADRTLVQ